tara:strand:- start:221 stop:574 length:354 start_codon:yes stop_codon:yes gene_type:complete
MICGILMVCGIILAPVLIPIFFSAYTESIFAIQIMSLVIVPTSITFILTSKLLGMENSRHVLISRIVGLCLIFPSMIILGLEFEIIGVAIAYLISNIGSTISLVTSNYIIKMHNNQI